MTGFEPSARVASVLACPACAESLALETGGARCSKCDVSYERTAGGALDLRPKTSVARRLEHRVGAAPDISADVDFDPLRPNPLPQVDYATLAVPHHLTPEVLSQFPKARGEGHLMLDLGCGDTCHREVSEHAGFEYVGLDYEAPGAPILGDAHCLPFTDSSFEFVLSIAVLEHIRYPFVMAREVLRVLEPGGVFIGSVSFLEPFHGDSYYHHTHYGVWNTLNEAGFTVKHVAPNTRWPALTAQASMSLFPKMPKPLIWVLTRPMLWLHRVWWLVGSKVFKKATEELRVRGSAGSFVFIAVKPQEKAR